MRGIWKRLFICLCVAVLCLPAGALAEFSPRFDRLAAEGGMTLTVIGRLESASKLSKQTLGIVNDWLSDVEWTASVGKDSRAEIRKGGETVLSAAVQRQSAYNLTVFSPSGNAYLSDPAKPDALSLLAGTGNSLPDVTALPDLYAAVAPALYEALEQYVTPKTVKEPTSIKNANAAASYVNYPFKKDAFNDVWPQVYDAILPALQEALKDQPQLCAELEETLSALTFSGECRFKRFLDKEGKELGLQFTGYAAKGEDKRKVTLFGGFTPDKGGYISLNLAPVSGKNSLKMNFGVKMTAKKGTNTLTADGSYTRTLDGVTTAYTLEASLKNAVKEENEHWTGKITWTATENKVKSVWTLNPDLTFDDAGLNGKIAVQKKEGNKVKLKGALTVRLEKAENAPMPAAMSAKDLRVMTNEQARAVVLAELVPLTGALARLTAELPENERTLLLHDLRTDEWMNGPAVPVAVQPADIPPVTGIQPVTDENEATPDDDDGESWVVEEDEQ